MHESFEPIKANIPELADQVAEIMSTGPDHELMPTILQVMQTFIEKGGKVENSGALAGEIADELDRRHFTTELPPHMK